MREKCSCDAEIDLGDDLSLEQAQAFLATWRQTHRHDFPPPIPEVPTLVESVSSHERAWADVAYEPAGFRPNQ